MADSKAAKQLLREAPALVATVDASDFAKLQKPRKYPTFEVTEIEIGKLLGVGGFGEVFEVEAFHLKDTGASDKNSDSSDPPENNNNNDNGGPNDEQHYDVNEARSLMATHVHRNGKDARYAIKKLHPDMSELEQVRGMIDMAIEAKFLQILWHPNIVKMRGYSEGTRLDPQSFIVMDRLYETLDKKLRLWKDVLDSSRKSSGLMSSLFGKKSEIEKQEELGILLERLVVAYDLASAFSYMHKNMLVYRDIKQENIGFDVRGDVKVFDFGLCKGLSERLKAKDSQNLRPVYGYNLTPRTGSMKYMAPEVYKGKPYDTKADVFSYAILLWEILTFKDAFKGFNRLDYVDRVVRRGERPALPRKVKKLSPALRELLTEAWDPDPEKRPNMKRMAAVIRMVMSSRSSDPNVLDRTTYMMEKSKHSYHLQRRAVESRG